MDAPKTPPEDGFTRTGLVWIEAGLDADNDTCWRAGSDGLTGMETLGLLVTNAAGLVLDILASRRR